MEQKTTNFLWKSIIYRFGLSWVIISDNDRQFNNIKFEEFCVRYHNIHKLTSVVHPQSNEEVEVTNMTILQGLKTRIDQAKDSWANELHSVLWSYQITPRISIKETPFKLAFGTEAIILVEIGLPSTRMEHYNESTNLDKRWADLDLLEEI